MERHLMRDLNLVKNVIINLKRLNKHVTSEYTFCIQDLGVIVLQNL